jgi:hypothetical protein
MLTLRASTVDKPKIPILLFADSILGIQPYDWQCQILLNYEAGKPTAAACANFTGKTCTVFPIAALWTLYNFPRARLMYLSATSAQVKNQFFASLERSRSRPGLAGWTWLETEVRNPHGGFLFGRPGTLVRVVNGCVTKSEPCQLNQSRRSPGIRPVWPRTQTRTARCRH